MERSIVSSLLEVGLVKAENIVCSNDVVKEKVLNIPKNSAAQSLKVEVNL
jgi:hypothetical protein